MCEQGDNAGGLVALEGCALSLSPLSLSLQKYCALSLCFSLSSPVSLSLSLFISVCLSLSLLSLLPSPSCLFSQSPSEKHIYEHLTDSLEAHHLFHSFQLGFRRGHSCQTALIRLIDTWLSAFNDRRISGAVFLDLCKAFDLVSHNIFIEKAIGLQFKHQDYHVLTILLTRSTTVRACKWHIIPRNVYYVWSSSRVDPRPPSVWYL